MERDQVRTGYDYRWNMAPREDGTRRNPFIRVTSDVRWDEKAGKEGGDYVVDAVFLQRDGTKEPMRYPVRVRYLDPVAYAQDVKKGDILSWQKQDFGTKANYYVRVVADGPRDDATETVPVIWHHEKPSRDGKPAGDSLNDVPSRYLFRQEAVDVMRATQPNTPHSRPTSPSSSERTAGPRDQRPAAPNPAYATQKEVEDAIGGLGSDDKILAGAILGLVNGQKPDDMTLRHLNDIVTGGKAKS